MNESDIVPLEWTDYEVGEPKEDFMQTYAYSLTDLSSYTIFKRNGQLKLWINEMVTYPIDSIEAGKSLAWSHHVAYIKSFFKNDAE